MRFRFILIDSLKVRTVFLDHLLSNFQEARFANNKIFLFRIQSIHISFLIYSVLLKYLTSVVKLLSWAKNPVLLSERSSLKIFSLLLIMSATSVRPVESRIGATFETYESRYSHTSKENWFFKISNCGMKPIPLSYNLPQNSEPLLLDTPSQKLCGQILIKGRKILPPKTKRPRTINGKENRFGLGTTRRFRFTMNRKVVRILIRNSRIVSPVLRKRETELLFYPEKLVRNFSGQA
ncbi:hypothetical protein LEP1GSC016_0832 [Leptospira borgpetersenii serovar Hardjo-bovis str. Sponselee]|uniref:Uncharacterized protein n=1 Tax=Leptospira borgpetersenii serovar Hardjo-bovis str. Sponselee TaxID=1303729 RepID=M6BZB2_LEPBO|nr:hypothetical protein LEP1GSC016_0832 [Leptospira borgpetersenii serovar Hardjo-bovis str. Sponselee]